MGWSRASCTTRCPTAGRRRRDRAEFVQFSHHATRARAAGVGRRAVPVVLEAAADGRQQAALREPGPPCITLRADIRRANICSPLLVRRSFVRIQPGRFRRSGADPDVPGAAAQRRRMRRSGFASGSSAGPPRAWRSSAAVSGRGRGLTAIAGDGAARRSGAGSSACGRAPVSAARRAPARRAARAARTAAAGRPRCDRGRPSPTARGRPG
jgi:hypothetical protein